MPPARLRVEGTAHAAECGGLQEVRDQPPDVQRHVHGALCQSSQTSCLGPWCSAVCALHITSLALVNVHGFFVPTAQLCLFRAMHLTFPSMHVPFCLPFRVRRARSRMQEVS